MQIEMEIGWDRECVFYTPRINGKSATKVAEAVFPGRGVWKWVTTTSSEPSSVGQIVQYRRKKKAKVEFVLWENEDGEQVKTISVYNGRKIKPVLME